jgi:hypothetical protein
MRWVAGENGLVVGMLFSDPVKSGENDKILWIVKTPRDGSPLRIRGTVSTLQGVVDFTPVPPDSEPGEIYPWTFTAPQPGCWRLALSWGAVQDVVAVPLT